MSPLKNPDGTIDWLACLETFGGSDLLPMGQPVEVAPGIQVRSFTLDDLKLLRRLGSFIDRVMQAGANQLPMTGEPTLEEHMEVAFVMTRPTAESVAELELSRDYFREVATREMEKLDLRTWGAVVAAIAAQAEPLAKLLVEQVRECLRMNPEP